MSKITIKTKIEYGDKIVAIYRDKEEIDFETCELYESSHCCGIDDLSEVEWTFLTNKKRFSDLSDLEILKIILIASSKKSYLPLIQGSIISKKRGSKKHTDVYKALIQLKGLDISKERKNPNSGNIVVSFQFDKLTFYKENKL